MFENICQYIGKIFCLVVSGTLGSKVLSIFIQVSVLVLYVSLHVNLIYFTLHILMYGTMGSDIVSVIYLILFPQS